MSMTGLFVVLKVMGVGTTPDWSWWWLFLTMGVDVLNLTSLERMMRDAVLSALRKRDTGRW